jgi:pimeloyl-ACP methyl ester carboxylesterase
MAFARRHAGKLAGLILADTKAEADDVAGREGRDKAIAAVRANGPVAFGESMLGKLLAAPAKDSPVVVEFVRKIATRQTEPAVIAALYALRDRPDATPGLDAVSVPTLVIVGVHDAVTPPAAAAKIAATLPNSELVQIPDAGHLSNIENPDAFNSAVIEFLRRLK